MKHEVLSLDFWQKTTIYGDKNFPCGTIGCDALNVPADRQLHPQLPPL